MPSELLALIAAFCYAGGFVLGKRGLSGTSIAAAVLVAVGAGWVVMLPPVLIDPPTAMSGTGVLLFALGGLISPGVGYSSALAGVERLGPSIGVPIQQGGRPLIAVSAALLFLHEAVSWIQVVGIVTIVVGGIGISRYRGAEREVRSEAASAGDSRSGTLRGAFRPGLAFPIMAALAFAGFDVVIKRSLQAEIEPTTGTMIAIGTGFTAWAIGVAVVPRVRRSVRVGPNLGWLVAGGMMFGVATLCLVHALSRGEVSVVSPILASQPLMVFILSKLFLGEVESVDLSTVVLGSLVVIGTVLVVL